MGNAEYMGDGADVQPTQEATHPGEGSPGKVSAPRRQGQHGPRINPPLTNLLRIERNLFRILDGNRVPLLQFYQKLACFQMLFMQMLIYVFIQMKTALTRYALHYVVGLVQFS